MNGDGSGWKEEVNRRYAELKAEGKSFFPYVVFKDVIAVVLVFAAVAGLAVWKGAGLEEPANPTDTGYNPRPEWYFLFFFELLKYFPGSLEAVATVVVPMIIIGFLILLPFLDKGPKRHPFDRPLITGSGVLGIAGVIYLSLAAYFSPPTNSAEPKNPLVLEGQMLYQQFRCRNCHSIGGQGGVVGPALDTVGSRQNAEWLTNHFRNPQKTSPGSRMPTFGLIDKEVAALVVYMSSLGGGSFTPEAPLLFNENCSICHKIGDAGGEIGPNLSSVSQYRDQGWLASYIKNPEGINSESAMPAFQDTLTPAQIENLSRYLSAQRGPISSKK